MFFAWLFVRTSAKFTMMSACFIVNFSRTFEKHALIVLPWNSDDFSSRRLYGPWKSEAVFRLTSVEFSAVFFLLILAAIMVTVTIAKMLKLLKIWKIDTDLKVKYTSLCPRDAFLSEISDVMMKASLALFIRLSHFYTQNWKARMNILGHNIFFCSYHFLTRNAFLLGTSVFLLFEWCASLM